MSVFSSRLIGRQCVAQKTLAVVLERPAGFVFRAGQYIDITLPQPRISDRLGPTRSFSIASAPSERNLLLIMRVRDSAFKRSLAEMPLGSSVLIDGPADDLSLTLDDGHATVLLAGGVGIAPFLSALREAAAAGVLLDATLFYSNRRPEDAAYLRELCLLTTRATRFRCVPIMTRMTESVQQWAGETERLGVPMLKRYLPALRGPRYYLSGTPGFISGLVQAIERVGVPGSDIRIEMYTGY